MLATWMISEFLFLGLFTILLASVWGGMAIALLSEAVGWAGSNKLLDKFALQLCRMSCVALLPLIGCCLVLAADHAFGPLFGMNWTLSLPEWPRQVWRLLLGIISAGVLFQVLAFFSWKGLKKRWKGVHLLFSLLSFLGFWAGSWQAVNWSFQSPGEASGTLEPLLRTMAILSPASDPVWPIFSAWIFLCFGGAGTMAGVFLLWRRERDDFGRDYYHSALPRAAKWGMIFGVQMIVLAEMVSLGFPDRSGLMLRSDVLALGLAALFCFLTQTLLLSIVSGSPRPLRLKGSVLAAALLAWIGESSGLAWVGLVLGSGPFFPA